MQRSVPILSVALAAVLGGCSSEAVRDDAGAVSTAGTVDAFSIEVGDCVAEADATEEVSQVAEVDVVPCAEPHDAEAYAAFDLPDGDFPGDDEVMNAADEGCYDAFADFVGMAYEESVLDFGTYYPTQASWEDLGDREVVCLVIDPEGAVSGSLERASR